MTDEQIAEGERLLRAHAVLNDHDRGCDGRCYACTCGFDANVEKWRDDAATHIREQDARLAEVTRERDESHDRAARLAKWLEDAEARLARAEELLREVRVCGMSYRNERYSETQIPHVLADEIDAFLAEQKG